MKSVYLQRIFRFLFVTGAVAAGAVSLYYLSALTYPFIFAWAIAFLMNPAVDFLEKKWKFPRALAVLIVLIIIFGIIIGLVTLLIAELISITEYLAKTLPGQIEKFSISVENWITGSVLPFFNELSVLFQNLDENYQKTIISNINGLATNIGTSLIDILQTIVMNLPGLFSWFPSAATATIFTVLGAFFISKDWHRLKKLITKPVPANVRRSSAKVYLDLKKALFGFIRAQLTLISITAVIVFIGLLILQVDYAFVTSLFIAFVDLLPYLGTGFVFVPWIIYELITADYAMAIGLLVLYIVVIVQRQVMEPKIVSTNIGISPLATLISIFAGLKLLGVAGLIIGPIVAVIISTLNKTGILQSICKYIKGNGA